MAKIKLGSLEINADEISAPIEIKKKTNDIAMTGRTSNHNFGVQNRYWLIQCWTLTKAEYQIVEDFVKTASSFIFTDFNGTEFPDVSVNMLIPKIKPYGYIAFELNISEDF